MESTTKLQEVQTLKDQLIAQQAAISDQLATLRTQEQELGRAARAEGLKQIGEIIAQNKIPKHEIIALYAELNIEIKIGRPPKNTKPVNNPTLENRAEIQETAARFTKLFENGMHPALLEEAGKCLTLEAVLILLPPNIEEWIVENL